MDSPFEYSKPSTGKYFYGRKQDVTRIRELIDAGRSIAIYGSPKSGKASLLHEAFSQMKAAKADFRTATVELLDIRDGRSFLFRLADTVIRAFTKDPLETAGIIERHLSGTSLHPGGDIAVSSDETLDGRDITALLRLPYALAREAGTRLIVVLNEFQNLTFIDGWENHFKAMENIMKAETGQGGCVWIATGSQVNAMKELFVRTKYFYRQMEVMTPSPIPEKELVDRILRGFMSSGKVVERSQMEKMCRLFRCNIWYVHHFISICDHLSKGYIMEPVIMEALNNMLSLHRPKFEAIMNDLTTYQVTLLRAVTEGCGKLSSAESIERYGFNSSANVRRLKDALMKKEIITFDSEDRAEIIDPLFEYWVRKYFFHQSIAIQ